VTPVTVRKRSTSRRWRRFRRSPWFLWVRSAQPAGRQIRSDRATGSRVRAAVGCEGIRGRARGDEAAAPTARPARDGSAVGATASTAAKYPARRRRCFRNRRSSCPLRRLPAYDSARGTAVEQEAPQRQLLRRFRKHRGGGGAGTSAAVEAVAPTANHRERVCGGAAASSPRARPRMPSQPTAARTRLPGATVGSYLPPCRLRRSTHRNHATAGTSSSVVNVDRFLTVKPASPATSVTAQPARYLLSASISNQLPHRCEPLVPRTRTPS